MISPFICVLAFALAAPVAAPSQDYSFDTSGLDARAYDLSASIELWPALVMFNRDSDLYLLKYGRENPAYADFYRLRAEADAQYRYGGVLAFASGAYNVLYQSLEDSTSVDARLYEGYLKYAPGVSFSVLAGKKMFRWGKAYAYSPVLFAGRQRDLTDVDAALEGYWNLSAEYIRGFSGALSAFAVTGVVLPVYGDINEGFLPDSTLAGAAQLYGLLLDTDIDGYIFVEGGNGYKTGIDFAKNVFPSWEIHGEWAYASDSRSTFFVNDTALASETRSAHDVVFGTRYLASFNTTFILEYLHLGSGLTADQMSAYYGALGSARVSGDPAAQRMTLQSSSMYYGEQFLMTDYLYVKATHPEPFTIVYFTPAVYSIFNLIDGSLMAGVEMTYNRMSRLLLTARCVAFAGPQESEYGVRQGAQRFELRAKWSF